MAFNFTLQPVNVLDSITQGYQLGSGIRADQQKQQLQQAAIAQQDQQRQMLASLAANPNATGDDYGRVITQIPSLAEPLTKAWAARSEEQNRNVTSDLLRWGSAIKSNSPQIAVDSMLERADAMERQAGAPTRESQALKANARTIQANPRFGLGMIQAMLAANPNGKDAAATLASFGKESREEAALPGEMAKTAAEIAKTQAEAGIKTVEAQNAPTRVALENESAQQGILNSEANRRIQELNTQISQANSETQRGQLVLERDKLLAEQAKRGVDKGNEAQGQFDAMQNTLGTIDRVLKHPGLEGFFYGAGTIGGKQAAVIPGTESRDFRALLDQLTSQQFLANIKQMSGMGALSNAEGEKIAAAAGNLSADQSQKQLKTTLGVIQSTLKRAQDRIVGSGNLSTSDKTFVLQSPQYGAVTDGQINRLLQQHPGATREQVLQFLEQSKGAR